jgi:hypothetical protein
MIDPSFCASSHHYNGDMNRYDGMVVFVQAIANVLASGGNMTGPNLLAAIKGISGSFTGASGPWEVLLLATLSQCQIS